MAELLARHAGAWEAGTPYARHNGVWLPVEEIWRREGGNWILRWQNEIAVTVGSRTALRLDTLFSAADWASDVTKRVIIPAGVEIGATSTSHAIATAETAAGQAGSFEGQLILDIHGTVSGIGGAANSGAGGNALWGNLPGRNGQKLIANNYGIVRAGGGGGGKGGTGGGGNYNFREPASGWRLTVGPPHTYWLLQTGNWNQIWWNSTSRIGALSQTGATQITVGGWTYLRGALRSQGDFRSIARQQTRQSNGGAGGNGGVGQGYNQARATGAAGGSASNGAGAGGTGGTGGLWGAAGATGATGANGNRTNGSAGTGGGASGAYLRGAANVIFNNYGTVQGLLVN